MPAHHRGPASAWEGESSASLRFRILLRAARAAARATPALAERIRSALPYPRLGPSPWTEPRKRIQESRIALVAACGVRGVGASPDLSAPLPDLLAPVGGAETAFEFDPLDGDVEAARRDPNVLFPLERLRDLERAGAIGSCSPLHFGLPDLLRPSRGSRIVEASSQALRERNVDGILCLGCGGGGALLACALSRALEAMGFATVAVVGPRRSAERMRPPRAIFVPGRSRRLLGEPGERALQRDILLFALRRIEAAARPEAAVRFTRRLGPTGARGPDD